MDNRKFGAFTSSQNPEEISNRIKGIVLASSSIIIFFATQFFHLTINVNDITSFATILGTVSGAIWTIYGFILSVIAYFTKAQ